MESMLSTRRFPAVAALLTLVLPAARVHAGSAPPTVAVMTLEAKAGVTPDAAELVSDRLCTSITDAKVFGRVVTNKELESTMGLEAKKQLLDCKSDSCAAEIAAAWAVIHMVTGSVGKLGDALILNLRLIDVKQGVAVSRQSEKVAGGEEALFDAIQPAVTRLLLESGLKTAGVAAPTAPAPPPEGGERSASVSFKVTRRTRRWCVMRCGGWAGLRACWPRWRFRWCCFAASRRWSWGWAFFPVTR